jgi:hypothetical protein
MRSDRVDGQKDQWRRAGMRVRMDPASITLFAIGLLALSALPARGSNEVAWNSTTVTI